MPEICVHIGVALHENTCEKRRGWNETSHFAIQTKKNWNPVSVGIYFVGKVIEEVVIADMKSVVKKSYSR